MTIKSTLKFYYTSADFSYIDLLPYIPWMRGPSPQYPCYCQVTIIGILVNLQVSIIDVLFCV